ncbi:MAG: helix-turn-helix domain-containing protein [Micromonosporaceae bacterium]|jgi:DNA-binding transcriptional ArsR family regulator
MYGPPRRPATEAEAKALASSVRLRILRVCLDEPHTNREIARRLGLNPGTTLHHVRKLVATGFLAPQPPRRGPRGSREIPYLSTRKSWWLETPGLGREMVDAFLAEYQRIGNPERVRVARLGLRLTDEEYEEVTGRIAALFEELAARPPSPGGKPYSLFFSLHPDVDREEPEPSPT